MNKTALKAFTLAASIVLLFGIYRIGGVAVALSYFAVVFVSFLFYLLSQNPRLLLKLNLQRFSRAINTKFEDTGGFFYAEGSYQNMPVGFREVSGWSGTTLEVYCRPERFSLKFYGQRIFPSERTEVKPGVIALSYGHDLFQKKELSDNDILDILEEFRKASRVVESGSEPYRLAAPEGRLPLIAAGLFGALLLGAVMLTMKMLRS
jgi:hypothetical protein